jgi:hypothetical protein
MDARRAVDPPPGREDAADVAAQLGPASALAWTVGIARSQA